MTKRHPLAVLATVVSLAAIAACGSGAPKTLIGVRKVSLSMAFKDEALTPPAPMRTVIKLVPAPLELIQQFVPEYTPPAPTLPARKAIEPFIDPCPKAPEGATPDEPAAVAIIRPPKEGVYLKQNTGSVHIEGGVVPLTLPYPPFSTLRIGNVKQSEQQNPYSGTVKITTFDTEEKLTPTLSLKSYYSYDSAQLNLVREEIVDDGTVTPFEPTPALEVLAFTGPGNTWNSAGIDTKTGAAGTVQGSIDANREIVDVCGKVVDTLKVSTDEHRLYLSDGSSTGSDNGKPIIQNYALQYGGLVLRREEHSTRVINVNGSRVVVHIDVVSKLISIEPTAGL